jgi:hypothetical protein
MSRVSCYNLVKKYDKKLLSFTIFSFVNRSKPFLSGYCIEAVQQLDRYQNLSRPQMSKWQDQVSILKCFDFISQLNWNRFLIQFHTVTCHSCLTYYTYYNLWNQKWTIVDDRPLLILSLLFLVKFWVETGRYYDSQLIDSQIWYELVRMEAAPAASLKLRWVNLKTSHFWKWLLRLKSCKLQRQNLQF